MQLVPEQPVIGKAPENETAEQRRERVLGYMDKTFKKAPEIKPVDIGLFAGVLDNSTLSKTGAEIGRRMHLIEGDFRDFKKIRVWAKKIAPELMKA